MWIIRTEKEGDFEAKFEIFSRDVLSKSDTVATVYSRARKNNFWLASF